MPKFELKQEHVSLIAKLSFETNVNTEYGDKYIPTINRKRPFGNSSVTLSVLEILGIERGDSGDFCPEKYDHAENLLIELPVALEIIVKYKTFQPGIYDVDKYGAYFNYERIQKYKALQEPLKEIEDTVVKTDYDMELMEELQNMCLNVHGSNPYNIINDLKWFHETEFLARAIAIFEKYQKKAEESGDEKIDRTYCR